MGSRESGDLTKEEVHYILNGLFNSCVAQGIKDNILDICGDVIKIIFGEVIDIRINEEIQRQAQNIQNEKVNLFSNNSTWFFLSLCIVKDS